MIIIYLIILILLLFNKVLISKLVITSFILWYKSLFPILYPSFIIIDLIKENTFLINLSIRYSKYFNKIFSLRSDISLFIIILSFMSGSPSINKLIKGYKDKLYIDKKEAFLLSCLYSNLSLPYLFYIKDLFNLNLLLYYLLIILFNIIFMKIANKGSKISIKDINKNNTLKILSKAISNNMIIMINILGSIIFFNILANLFFKNNLSIIFIEILSGINYLQSVNITKKLKQFILIFCLSFLGVSIHMQIYMIDDSINYKFILIKLLQSLFVSSSYLLLTKVIVTL